MDSEQFAQKITAEVIKHLDGLMSKIEDALLQNVALLKTLDIKGMP